jgi:hypothetical protein
MIGSLTAKDIQQALEVKYTNVMDLLVIDSETIENANHCAIMADFYIGPYNCSVGVFTPNSDAAIENDTAVYTRFACIANTYFKF